MGNNKSLSAEINHGESTTDITTSVRHRNGVAHNNNHNVLTASVVEEDSGAYISRTAYKAELPDLQFPVTDHPTIKTAAITKSQLSVPPDIVAMNDSGYLEFENIRQRRRASLETGAKSSSSQTSGSMNSNDGMKVNSVRSSLSDQMIHDLESDCGSLTSYQGLHDLLPDEEDILTVEIYDPDGRGDLTLFHPETASTNTLIGSMGQPSDSVPESGSSTARSTDTEKHVSPEPPRESGVNSRSSDAKDSWTDSSEFWRELDELSSPISLPSPRHPQALRLSTENLSSSGHSSPLFVPKPHHSRTSSVTSADIEIEANCDTSNVSSSIAVHQVGKND